MTASRRIDQALALTATAAFGLVAAPILHAEEHCREAQDETAAIRASWEAQATDPADLLAFALTHSRRTHRPSGHSHGPQGSGGHGDGTVAHLSIALHAAPDLPSIEPPRPRHRAPAPMVGQLGETLRYLVPAFAQGPPERA